MCVCVCVLFCTYVCVVCVRMWSVVVQTVINGPVSPVGCTSGGLSCGEWRETEDTKGDAA